jgi:two-component system sensor histidine kinase KdpD
MDANVSGERGKPGAPSSSGSERPSLSVRAFSIFAAWPEVPTARRTAIEAALTLASLLAATLLGFWFDSLGMGEAPIVIIYVLSVQVVALVTTRRLHCVIATAASVLLFNYFFIDPRLSLHAWGPQYPGAFAVMGIVALLSSTLAMSLRHHAHLAQENSRLMAFLLQTDHLLQDCTSADQIVDATGRQLASLLDRDVVWYEASDGGLVPTRSFSPSGMAAAGGETRGPSGRDGDCMGSRDALTAPAPTPDVSTPAPATSLPPDVPLELPVAMRALENGAPAGRGTDGFASAAGLYVPVGDPHRPDGVMGIVVGDHDLTPGQRDVAMAVLGETGLALGRERATRERQRAELRARNEQLRADLLRGISHDIRTPLTSISGSADVLLSSGDRLAPSERDRLLRGIRDDATWLVATVQNLLAITRLQSGGVRPNLGLELMDDVVEEALRHVDPRVSRHRLTVEPSRGVCLVRVDASLMVQVVVNLVNNAVKHTPDGSSIVISLHREGDSVVTTVCDDGPGIPAADRERVFDSFYTVGRERADVGRGFGLGLSLCRSIVTAHGGTIGVGARQPHGSAFWFRLPACELPGGGDDEPRG